MAKKPQEPAASQTAPVEIAIASIVVPKDRLWKTRPESVDLLADAILENGYITPIAVCAADANGKYALIDGAHRLEAAKQLGREVIPATVFSGSKLQQRLLEIDSNLIRRNMTQLEEAVYLAERERIYNKLYPVAGHGGDRKSDQVAKFGTWSERFTKVAAKQSGGSERSVQLALWRFSKIAQDVRTLIGDTWIADKGIELDALAKLEPDEQRKAVSLVLSGAADAPKTIAAAKNIIRGVRNEREADPNERLLAKLTALFDNAPARVQADFLTYLEQEGRVTLPDARGKAEAA